MKIISWNVNGIRAAQKKGFIEWLKKESPEIIGIQETKAQKEQLDEELLNIDGYESYFFSAEKKGYSGVAIYSKVKPNKVEYGLGIDKFDSEGRVITAHFNDFIFSNIYFPNGKQSKERLQYKMDFYDAFLKKFVKYKNEGKKIIFCGDVNTAHKPIDLARPKENEETSGFLPIERAWIDKCIESGFIDSLREFHSEPNLYSWWDLKTRARERNVGWRIDYFFVSENCKKSLKDAFILNEVMGSDHCPIGIEFKI